MKDPREHFQVPVVCSNGKLPSQVSNPKKSYNVYIECATIVKNQLSTKSLSLSPAGRLSKTADVFQNIIYKRGIK